MLNINNFRLLDMRSKAFEAFSYPAGEMQVRLPKELAAELENENNPVVVINNVGSPESIIETILFLNAVDGKIKDYIPRFLILPYLPYSRADRRFTDGDCLGKEAFLNMLPMNWDIYTFDVHSDKSNSGFLINVTPENILRKIFKKYNFENILFPDAGAMSRYSEMIDKFNIPANIYFCEKKRDPETGKFLGFKVPTDIDKTKNTIIIDDLCDGGGTFLGIANELQMDKSKLTLYVSHGIFSKGFSDLTKYFDLIITTNSFGRNANSEDRTINLFNGLTLEILNIDSEFEEPIFNHVEDIYYYVKEVE